MNKLKALRLLRAILAIGVIGMALKSVLANWEKLPSGQIDWHFSTLTLAVSTLLVFVSYGFLIEGWRRLAGHLDRPIPPAFGARIWFLASLGKYLPGKIWAMAGAGVMASEAGFSGSAAAGAAVIMQILSIISGSAIALAVSPAALQAIGADQKIVAAMALVTVVAGVTAITNKRFMVAVSRLLPAAAGVIKPIPAKLLIFPFAASSLAWACYGLAFNLLSDGLLPGANLSFLNATAAFSIAYLAGFVFLLVPGGVGVREGAMVLLLTPALGPRMAAGLAIASRIQLTIAEIVGALLVLPVKKGGNRKTD